MTNRFQSELKDNESHLQQGQYALVQDILQIKKDQQRMEGDLKKEIREIKVLLK